MRNAAICFRFAQTRYVASQLDINPHKRIFDILLAAHVPPAIRYALQPATREEKEGANARRYVASQLDMFALRSNAICLAMLGAICVANGNA